MQLIYKLARTYCQEAALDIPSIHRRLFEPNVGSVTRERCAPCKSYESFAFVNKLMISNLKHKRIAAFLFIDSAYECLKPSIG